MTVPAPWISVLPSGWRHIPMRRVVLFRNGADYKDVEVAAGGFPVYGSGGEFRRANSYLHDGESVLFGRKGTIDKPLHVSGKFWTVDTMFYTVPNSKIVPRFLYYVATTIPFGYYSTATALPSMTQSDLARHTIPLPPVNEQLQIVNFLDREIAQIECLLAKQEELVDLLADRRATLVRMAIPTLRQHMWPIDKLGRWARVGNGSTPRRDEERFWSGGSIPWLTSTVVNLNRVENANEFVTPAAVRECHLPIVESGSLLIGLIGQGPTRGMATISRIRATLSQNLAYISPDPTRWVPEYLLWSLRASYREIRQRGAESGAAQAMLNTDDIKRHRLVMPPLEEQCRISAHLDDQTAKIDALIAKADEFITLARERRAALITDAVTGRIDVSTGKARKGA